MNAKIKNKILFILNDVRPFLQADSGDVELIELTDKLEVRLKIFGNCRNCGMRHMTMKAVVEDYLRKEIPEIKSSSIIFFNSDMISSASSSITFNPKN